MSEPIQLKPFHESIVPTINTAEVGTMQTLAYLIRDTKIPKNHDAIVAAWQKRVGEVGLNTDLEVVASVLGQKEAEIKKKMEPYALGKSPPGVADDGSFDLPTGGRGYSIVDKDGKILVIDKATSQFVEEKESADV